jgi:hypothetical protein
VLKAKDLRGRKEQKKGGPRNEGISYDLYEKKERKKAAWGKSYDVVEIKDVTAHDPTMFMKTNGLIEDRASENRVLTASGERGWGLKVGVGQLS